MDCREASLGMHEYLDGTLAGNPLKELKEHIDGCSGCRERFNRLEQTEALIRIMPEPDVPRGLAEKIMMALPKPGRRTLIKRWIKRHPAVSVAAIFIMVMMSSFLSLWDKGGSLVVKGADLEDVVIQGDVVTVPQGSTIDGDLTVENGKLHVDGTINGNLIVVDSSYYLASTASIAGQVTDIHQTIDYFWFRVKEFLSGFSR